MRITSLVVIAVLTGGLLLPASAAEDPLAPLDFLVGSCWDGTFVGSSKKDLHCFTRIYDGKYVRDVHRVDNGPYRGESIYAWDPEAKRITYTYYNSAGGVSRGTAEGAKDALSFGDERFVGRDGKEIVMRSMWVRDGADGYTAITQQRDGETWREVRKIVFKRLPGPPAVLKPE